MALTPGLPSLGLGNRATDIAVYALGAICFVLVTVFAYLWLYCDWTLSYRDLPGPPRTSWFWGNLQATFAAEPGAMHAVWTDTYGPTFRYRMLFGTSRVCTADPVALTYIFTHVDKFPKPGLIRQFLVELLGNGRRALNPCFSPQSIRDILPIFYDKAEELRGKLLGLIQDDSEGIASPTPTAEGDAVPGGRKIEVMRYLGMCTIDIVGPAAFGYEVRSLSQPNNELFDAFSTLVEVGQDFNAVAVLQTFVPYMDRIPTKRMAAMRNSKATTQRIGRSLVAEKKWAIEQSHSKGGEDVGRDILSTCIRANMAADVGTEQKMTDEEVLSQITTFVRSAPPFCWAGADQWMLAGNETSSSALTWVLYLLSQHPDIQAKLREECLAVTDTRPSLEDISALPYLDAVLHETLRLYSPVPSTLREAAEDVIVPLGTPVKDRNGRMIDSMKLSQGSSTYIPISVVNTSKQIWGPDAHLFNPSRHLSTDDTFDAQQKSVPGVWGSSLTFLGGRRSCVGLSFALAEMKVILFVLIRSLEFEELASKPKIVKKATLTMRPGVIGEEAAGPQMPLMVKPYTQAQS